MNAVAQWFWRLLPGNPIVVRLVQGGSRRVRHLWVRMGYLGALILLVVIGLLSGGGMGDVSITDLAKAGTWVFAIVSRGQVVLICLLAPLFMAGAIGDEQAGKTFDILLTTPLSNLQIVLGSLAGRLFFVLMLLASGLPLFSVLLLFGGVPIGSVFVAFGVAGLTALAVGSAAIALSVWRKGGRKVVFVFVIASAAYLVACYGADQLLRAAPGRFWQTPAPGVLTPGTAAPGSPGSPGSPAAGVPGSFAGGSGGAVDPHLTTWLTPLHPLLVLDSYVNTADYHPPAPEDLAGYSPLVRFYICRPLAAFALISSGLSVLLILWSAVRLRRVGQGEPGMIGALVRWVRWRRERLGLDTQPGPHPGPLPRGEGVGGGPQPGKRRKTRHVWDNPIAWQEAHSRSLRWAAWLGRWGFLVLGLGLGAGLIWAYDRQSLPSILDPSVPGQSLAPVDAFRSLLMTLLLVEVAAVVLVALYMSAGSVSREREDGTLDLLLATPLTPRQYLWGKLRGLVSFLSVLLAVPVLTFAGACVYCWVGAARGWAHTQPPAAAGAGAGDLLMMPESMLLLPLMLLPFVALCVAIGLNWSVKARGVLGAIIPSVLLVGVVVLVLGMCGWSMRGLPVVGALVNAFSPATQLWMLIDPWGSVKDFGGDRVSCRLTIGVGALLAALVYGLVVYGILQGLVRGFDQSVRKLSGTGG